MAFGNPLGTLYPAVEVMARTSRIRHPSGGRYVQIHAWAVAAVGREGAAVIGLMDFLDRAHEQPDRPLASRARIIADLQGVVGRNAIDGALARLVELGWLRLHVETQVGRRNLSTTHYYSLDASAVNEYVEKHVSGIPGFGKTRFPISGHQKSHDGDRSGDHVARVAEDHCSNENHDAPRDDGGLNPAPSTQKKKEKNKSTTTSSTDFMGGGGADVNELVEAAMWEAKSLRPVSRPTGYRVSIRKRLMASGPTPEDLDTLARWREWKSKQSTVSVPAVDDDKPFRYKPPVGWRESILASITAKKTSN